VIDLDVLKNKITKLDLSISSAAALIGGSAGNLNAELAGKRTMGRERFDRLNDALDTLLSMSRAIAPFTLDTRNITALRGWMALWQNGNLTIEIKDSSADKAGVATTATSVAHPEASYKAARESRRATEMENKEAPVAAETV
jgi:hypothetical protein